MTTWKLPTASSAAAAKGGMDDDLLDLMSSLDDMIQKDKRSAPQAAKAAPKAPPAPPPFIQQWFPNAVVMHATRQECSCCGHLYESVTGLFLEDRHRNGAIQQKRVVANVVPPEYFSTPKRQQWTIEEIGFCIVCFQTEFKVPEAALPEDLVRALSQDDINSLKGEA